MKIKVIFPQFLMFAVKEMHIHIRIYIPEIKRILLTGIMLRDKDHKCDFNRRRKVCAGYVSTAGHLDRSDCCAPGKKLTKTDDDYDCPTGM